MDNDEDMAITPTTSYPQNEQTYNPQKHSHALDSRNRTDSLISIDTTYTVRTNIDQTHLPNVQNPHLNFQRNRGNSNVSLSSSVFSEIARPQMDAYSFTSLFDDELYSYYISYSQQPNITPFDIRFPPSGILSLLSKLFLENYVLSNFHIAIDNRPDVNADLLADTNRHSCLAVIRLRLIHLCNVNNNMNAGNLSHYSTGNANLNNAQNINNSITHDESLFGGQLPLTRCDSIASASSFTDRVYPSTFPSALNNGEQGTGAPVPPPTVHRPSWLHLPNFTSTKSRENSYAPPNLMLSSTDSLIDRVQLNNTSSEPGASGQYPSLSASAFTNSTGKRDKPSLNLNMPTFTPSRSNSNLGSSTNANGIGGNVVTPNSSFFFNNMPPRPSFTMGGTPTTPNTPNTPLQNANSQRNPRGVRSSSVNNNNNAGMNNYFSLTPTGGTHASSSINLPTPNKSTTTSLMNPTLNHIMQSPSDLQSPYEQSFPSPLGLGPHNSHNNNNNGVFTAAANANPNSNTNTNTNNNTSSSIPASSSTNPNPSTPTTYPSSDQIYGAIGARKRDSLKLKRGLN